LTIEAKARLRTAVSARMRPTKSPCTC
jgi:hypothetical protein